MNNAKLTTGVLVGCVMLLSVGGVRAQDWPQWRGPNRDNKVAGFTEPKTWPKELTKKWNVKVGLGDSSPVLVGDKVYVFTREGDEEVIRCLDAAKGTEVWKDKYTAKAVENRAASGHPGPRSSPAVANGKVCTFGVAGVISCLDAAKGKVVWRKDTKEFPSFYTSASPIIVDDQCIIHIGKDGGRGGMAGKGAIIAYDLASGEEKWKWEGEGPGYASPVVLTVDGTKQFVTLTENAVVGVNLADGKRLWHVPFAKQGMGYNSVTPVVDGHTVIYAREGTGTLAIKIEKKEDSFATKELWTEKAGPGKYNTPMFKDGLLYGLSSKRNLYCMKADTGKVLWTDEDNKRGECGGVLDAGSVLLLFSSDSYLVAFKPGDKGFTEVAKYKIADSPTWAYPIIAGNRVFAKDKDSVTLWTID
jgi:outer membrane protein assembly factor BamB